MSVECGRPAEGKGDEADKEDFLKNVHVLSCFVQLKSILLITCVLDLFSERWQSTLFQIYFLCACSTKLKRINAGKNCDKNGVGRMPEFRLGLMPLK